jgi:hypothetical protein
MPRCGASREKKGEVVLTAKTDGLKESKVKILLK